MGLIGNLFGIFFEPVIFEPLEPVAKGPEKTGPSFEGQAVLVNRTLFGLFSSIAVGTTETINSSSPIPKNNEFVVKGVQYEFVMDGGAAVAGLITTPTVLVAWNDKGIDNQGHTYRVGPGNSEIISFLTPLDTIVPPGAILNIWTKIITVVLLPPGVAVVSTKVFGFLRPTTLNPVEGKTLSFAEAQAVSNAMLL